MPKNTRQRQIHRGAAITLIGLLSILTRDSNADAALDKERLKKARALLVMDATNWEEALQYWTDDIVYQDPAITIEGKEAAGEYLENLFEVMPIYSLEIHNEAYSGNTYMAQWTMQGIWLGYHYVSPGMSIMKFRDGESNCHYHKDLFTEADIWKEYPILTLTIRWLRTLFKKITKVK